MGAALLGALDWLNKNSGAVTATVTAIYTFFTLLLWIATKRQATLTREIFVATHRPHVSIRPLLRLAANPGFVRLDLLLTNHGAIPAQVTQWAASLKREQSVLAEAATLSGGLCVFPGAEGDAPHLRVDGQAATATWQANPPVYLHAKVLYCGSDAVVYSTALRGRLKVTGQHQFDFDEVEHEVR